MNALGLDAALAWLPIGGWQRLAADALWQSTALAGAGLLLTLLFRRRAALRAAILLAAAVLSVAVPVLSSAVRATGSGLLPAPLEPKLAALPLASVEPRPIVKSDRIGQVPVDDRPVVESGSTVFQPAIEPSSIPPNAATRSANARTLPQSFGAQRIWLWLAGAWLVASGLSAWRLVRGWLSLGRALRSAEECGDPAICSALIEAAEMLRVNPPQLLRSSAFETPALVALFRPRLLVPPKMPAGVDWFAVFCHELAHLARRDGASRLVVELCLVLLPWQPLVWLVRRQFRSACEEACDDWAVASGADPVELASLLVALVPQFQPTLALGMAESPAATRQRVVRLLAMKGAVRPQLGLALGVLGWMLATGLAVAVAMLQFGRPASPAGTDSRSAHDAAGLSGSPPWGDENLNDAIARAVASLPEPSARPTPYVIQPPDVLQLSLLKLVPRSPYRLEPEDELHILVANPLIDQSISGNYPVDIDGEISLGPAYGSIKVSGLTMPEARESIENQLKTVLREPQIQATLSKVSSLPPLSTQRSVAPDGTINLGAYGIVYVAGKTIGQATEAIEAQLGKKLERPQVSLEVNSGNSESFYLVIGDLYGEQLIRVPHNGGETVLDALANGMRNSQPTDPADYWVWVARPADTNPPPPEPTSKQDVITTIDGVVEEVLIEYGQQVKKGDVLARLSNKELEDQIANGAQGLPAPGEQLPVETDDQPPPPRGEQPADDRPAGEESNGAKQDGAGKTVVRTFTYAVPFQAYELTPGTTVRLKSGQTLAFDLAADDDSGSPADSETEDRTPPTTADFTEPPVPNEMLDDESQDAAVEAPEWLSESQLTALEKQRKRLIVTSPVDGAVSTPRVRDRLLHRSVRQGQVLMTIAEADEDDLPPARAAEPRGRHDLILPVDWQAVVAGTDTTSNWQLKSGDRVIVRQKPKR